MWWLRSESLFFALPGVLYPLSQLEGGLVRGDLRDGVRAKPGESTDTLMAGGEPW